MWHSTKIIQISFLLCCLGLVGTDSSFSSPIESGKDLAKKVYQRPDGQNASVQALMILKEAGHKKRIRRMYNYRQDKGEREVWSLIRFTHPPDIDGVGLLTKDYPGENTDQWLYLPALGKSRRIATDRKGGRFVGSDLFYEDLRDREVKMDQHRILRQAKFHGVECKVLESTPSDPSNSVYSKRVSWIHPGTLIPLKVDFYHNGHDTPIKRLVAHRVEKIQGYWTVMDSTMKDLRSKHRTRLRVEEITYNQDLPDSLFSLQSLEDPVREVPYRPQDNAD